MTHRQISYVKSTVRLLGAFAAIVLGNWYLLAAGIAVGEVLGIIEEMGDNGETVADVIKGMTTCRVCGAQWKPAESPDGIACPSCGIKHAEVV